MAKTTIGQLPSATTPLSGGELVPIVQNGVTSQTTVAAIATGGAVTSVTATSPILSSGGTTPVISLPAATTSTSGYLTSTDWNTFNSKGSGTVTGTGTANYLSKFTSSTAIGNSVIFDNGTNVGIGTSSPTVKLDIGGSTALAIQASLTSGADNNFHLYAVNGATGNAAGTEVARFGVGYGGNASTSFSSGFSFIRGAGATDGSLAILTSASERMRIDASGNVGINGASAVSKLGVTVNTTNGDGIAVNNSNNSGYFTLQANGSTGSGVSGWANSIVFEAVPASTGGFVLGAYSGNMIFQTGGRQERMRIDSSGNVGIGITSPTTKLDVNGGIKTNTGVITSGNGLGGPYVYLDGYSAPLVAEALDANAYSAFFTNNYAGPYYGFGVYVTDAGQSYIYGGDGSGGTSYVLGYDPASGMTQLGTGIYLNNLNGYVGIGTNAPAAKLDVSGGHLRLGDDWSLYWGDGSSSINGNSTSDFVKIATNSTERMRINSSGNVGIGTSSPGYLLDVQSTSTSATYYAGKLYSEANVSGVSATYLRFEKGTGYGGAIGGYISQGVGSGLVLATVAAGTFTDQMWVTSAGNVGIGTASPTTKLDVNGTTRFGATGADTITLRGQVSANSSVGTSGQVLTSQGVNLPPQWTTPTSGTVTSVTATSPVASTGGATPVISMPAATTSVSGYLTSTDWNTFNNKQPAGSYLTAVTADAPLTGSGTAASHLSIPAATTSTNGYLSSTDWNTFNGKQGALTLTTTGTSGAATLVGNTLNIPQYSGGGSGTVTSVTASTTPVSGLYLSGGTITSSGTIGIAGTLNLSAPPAIGGTTPNTITGTTIIGNAVRSYGRFTVDDTGTSGYTAELGVDGNGYAVIGGSSSVGGPINQAILAPVGLQFGNSSTAVLTLNAAPSTTYTLTLPTTAGSNNQVLKTDGTGNLSWLDFASPPAIGGTTPAAGTFTTLVANTSLGVGVASPSALLNLKAGTATAGTAPLKFTSGTNLTTAEAGAMEYNGTSVFITGTTASGRGINFAPQMVRINTDRPKTNNSTTLEAVFDAANDTLALAANTLYYFKGVYVITKTASATAAGVSIGFAFSNAQQDIGYKSIGYTAATGTAQTTIYNTVATGITATATATGAVDYVVELEGWFKSNATTGGTLIPQFAQTVVGTGAAPSAKANTWFMIQPMSSTPTATLIAGNWS